MFRTLSGRFSRPVVALLLVAGLAACDSADGGPNGARPTPVAPAAFQLGADSFPAAQGRSAMLGGNYVTSAARVGIVSVVVGATLILPHEATRIAAQATPVEAGGTFTWASTATIAGGVYDVSLAGTPAGSQVAWRLTVDPPNDAPFTLYTAQTSLDGKTGTWTLFDGAAESVRAAFDVRTNPEVTFSIPSARPAGGSSVRYQSAGTTRTFDWNQQPENARHRIEWDDATRAGSITAPDWNGGVRSCWNASLDDVNCR